VSSGFIDTAGDRQKEKGFCKDNLDISYRGPLSWQQVRKIDKTSHCKIGGHTQTHPRLAQIPKKEAFQEIQADKNKIENQLDKKITHFAFPYGKRADISGAEDEPHSIGYEYVYSTDINFVDQQKLQDSVLPRTMVSLEMPKPLLRCFVEGAYDIKNYFNK